MILERWSQVFGRKPEARAIVSCAGETVMTFGDVEARARDIESQLGSFPAGAVIAVQIGNAEEWPSLFLALLRRSLVCLPLAQNMSATERDGTLDTLQVGGVVEKAETGQLTVTPRGGQMPDWGGREPVLLKLTSGTEAAPRAVRFRADQLVADCDNICETMGIREEDLNFGVIPFSHSYGFSNLITPLLCRGVPLVPSKDRMPRAMLQDIENSGATIFPGMPLFFQKLGELDDIPPLKNLRTCISAGAPLPVDVAHQFTAKSGLKVHSFYGASECGGIAYDSSPTTFYEEGFVGPALRNVTIDSAAPAPADAKTPGPISIRSTAVGDGFFPASDAEGQSLRDGSFVPADLVLRINRGLYIMGRTSDFINVAGRKLHPRELELALRNHPHVRQVVAFGVPSSLRNEEVVACIAADRGAVNGEEIMAIFRERLSDWQVPKDLWIIDEVPVSERGKLNRRELAEAYLAQANRGSN